MIKRLDVPDWLTRLNHPIFGDGTKECLETYEEIFPAYFKDGFYFYRQTNFAWYEFGGRAWTQKGLEETFKFEFGLLDSRRLNKNEVEAIKTLMVYNNCPQSLKDMLYKDKLNRQLNETYWSARLWSSKTLKKFKNKKCK